MTLLRALAVVGLSLSAQAKAEGTMPSGMHGDMTNGPSGSPCTKLQCAADSYCDIDMMGIASCRKFQTIGGNMTNGPSGMYGNMTNGMYGMYGNMTNGMYGMYGNMTNGTNGMYGNMTNGPYASPCAKLQCAADSYCDIDMMGIASCQKFQTIGGNMTSGPSGMYGNMTNGMYGMYGNMTNGPYASPCAKLQCAADSYCDIDMMGIASCQKFQTIGGNMTNGPSGMYGNMTNGMYGMYGNMTNGTNGMYGNMTNGPYASPCAKLQCAADSYCDIDMMGIASCRKFQTIGGNMTSGPSGMYGNMTNGMYGMYGNMTNGTKGMYGNMTNGPYASPCAKLQCAADSYCDIDMMGIASCQKFQTIGGNMTNGPSGMYGNMTNGMYGMYGNMTNGPYASPCAKLQCAADSYCDIDMMGIASCQKFQTIGGNMTNGPSGMYGNMTNGMYGMYGNMTNGTNGMYGNMTNGPYASPCAKLQCAADSYCDIDMMGIASCRKFQTIGGNMTSGPSGMYGNMTNGMYGMYGNMTNGMYGMYGNMTNGTNGMYGNMTNGPYASPCAKLQCAADSYCDIDMMGIASCQKFQTIGGNMTSGPSGMYGNMTNGMYGMYGNMTNGPYASPCAKLQCAADSYCDIDMMGIASCQKFQTIGGNMTNGPSGMYGNMTNGMYGMYGNMTNGTNGMYGNMTNGPYASPCAKLQCAADSYCDIDMMGIASCRKFQTIGGNMTSGPSGMYGNMTNGMYGMYGNMTNGTKGMYGNMTNGPYASPCAKLQCAADSYCDIDMMGIASCQKFQTIGGNMTNGPSGMYGNMTNGMYGMYGNMTNGTNGMYGNMTNGPYASPCAKLQCAADSYCDIDMMGIASCQKFQTIGGNMTNGPSGMYGNMTNGMYGMYGNMTNGTNGMYGNMTNGPYASPCAKLQCAADSYCDIDMMGIASCRKFQTIGGNMTSGPSGMYGNMTNGMYGMYGNMTNGTKGMYGNMTNGMYGMYGNMTNGTNGMYGNMTNGPYASPCAKLQCAADSYCDIDMMGIASCQKFQTIGGNMTNGPSGMYGNMTNGMYGMYGNMTNGTNGMYGNMTNGPYASPCAKLQCAADSYCDIDMMGIASCQKFQTVGRNMTNGSMVEPPMTDDIEWCMRVTERTAAERQTCCQYGFGCATKPFDCTTETAMWSEEQQMFCCFATRDGKGCKEQCPMTRAAQDDAGAYCCEVRGACGAEYFAEQSMVDAATDEQSGTAVSTQVRTQLDKKLVDVADLLASPKAALRKVRLMLLAASEELKKDPSRLTVTKIGVLENGAVPAAEKEQALTVPVPEAWNRALLGEEAELCEAGWGSAARGARALAGTEDARVYAEFRVAGSDAGTAEQTAQHVATAVGGVKVAPGASAPAPTGSSSSSTASGVVIGLGAALGALCLGGLVAFTVMRKRKTEKKIDIEMVEDWVHEENLQAAYSPVAVSCEL